MTNFTKTQLDLETRFKLSAGFKLESRLDWLKKMTKEADTNYGMNALHRLGDTATDVVESAFIDNLTSRNKNFLFSELIQPVIESEIISSLKTKHTKSASKSDKKEVLDAQVSIINGLVLLTNSPDKLSRYDYDKYRKIMNSAITDLFKKKKTPAELNSLTYTIVLPIIDSISDEPTLMGMINKIIRGIAILFSKDRNWQEEFNIELVAGVASLIQAFEQSETNNVFEIGNHVGSSEKRLLMTETFKNKADSIIENTDANTTEYAPMVCEPRPHISLIDGRGGYLTSPSPLLKVTPKLNGKADPFVANFNYSDVKGKAFLDKINEEQSTAYQVNLPLLNLIMQYGQAGVFFDGYATELSDYAATMESELVSEINRRNASRQAWATATETEFKPLLESTVVKSMNAIKAKYRNECSKTKLLLEQAMEYSVFPKIYYPVFVDFRGRRYPYCLYGLTPMGCEMSKALLVFADKQVLTADGVEQLYATLGNALGYDKHDFDYKVQQAKEWYNNFDGSISKIITNEDGFDEPVSVLGVYLELKAYYQNPTTYKSGYINHRDARCSGSSIIGAATGDKHSMLLTSVLDSDTGADHKLPDAYGAVAKTALSICEADAANGNLIAKICLNHKHILFNRKAHKYGVMVVINYGGTDSGLRENINQLFEEHEELEELDKSVRGYFMDISKQSLASALPVSSAFLAMANKAAKEHMAAGNSDLRYTVPTTGFPVIVYPMKFEKSNISVCRNYTRFRLVLKKPLFRVDSRKVVSGFTPHLIHSIDGSLIADVRGQTSHNIANIHDSIGAHANDVTKTVKAYAAAMVNLKEADIFNEIIKQLDTTVKVPVPSDVATDFEYQQVLNSKHILC